MRNLGRSTSRGSFDTCESGERVAGASLGLRMAMGRLGFVAEISLADQFISHRESRLYDDAFAHRRSRGAILLRYGSVRPMARSFDLLAGLSLTIGDSLGVARVKEGFAPFAGRRPLAQRSKALGFTVGTDVVLPLTDRLSLALPARFTLTPYVPQDAWPGRLDSQAGVAFRFGIDRSIR